MIEIKLIIAKNIADLRKTAGMTQADLGNQLNYSDKAVSKWERGESLPDIIVLKQITDMFGVSVDYLLHEEHEKHEMERSQLIQARNANRIIITLLSTALVWLIATIVFVLLELLPLEPGRFLWLSYAYAIPASMIVLLVFNSIWGKRRRNFLIISLLMWSILLCIYLSYPVKGTGLLLLVGIPSQVMIILWGNLKSLKGIAKLHFLENALEPSKQTVDQKCAKNKKEKE